MEWVKKPSTTGGWHSELCFVYRPELVNLYGWSPFNPTFFDEILELTPEEINKYWDFAPHREGEKVCDLIDDRDQA